MLGSKAGYFQGLYISRICSDRLASSRMQFSRIFYYGQYECNTFEVYFKVLYFTNLVCTTKFLKYKSLENFQHNGSPYCKSPVNATLSKTRIQSTPLIKDTLVPAPLSFIEGVSSTEGFWSSSSYMPLYHHLGTSEAELILSEGMRLCIR